MATPKMKPERKQTTITLTQRRNSIAGPPGFSGGSEEINLRDVLVEIQKLSNKIDKIDSNQKDAQEQLLSIRKDMKEEFSAIKKEVKEVKEEIKEVKKDCFKLETEQRDIKKTIDKLEDWNANLDLKQELLEQREMEYQLRLRNVKEDPKENLRKIIVGLTAEVLKVSTEQMQQDLDRVYRINTNYARRHNSPL
nr:PREDICTED: uncharacterized protein PF11_0207-like [Anolis carolinensis]|eukprot:XP_016854509.1 PREDICTED: uncharacterized protein PF11_0207-like [Anolis carolinensis]